MTRPLIFVLTLAATLALSPAAFADMVVGSPGAGWQSWVLADLNQNGSPFWDNGSWDGSKKNIGYCLTGTGACGMPDYPGVLPYWGMASGTYDNSFSFTREQPSSHAALKIEIAGNAGSNEFGWYDVANPNTLNMIFAGAATQGVTAVYTPSAQYGFYLRGPGGTFKTGFQGRNFALFKKSTQEYWLGIEDLRRGGSDKDYNDMVVKISTATVPDGGVTLMLLGGALVGLETLRRRFRA